MYLHLSSKSTKCGEIYLHIVPGTCLSSWGLNPPKQGLFQSKQGSFGFQVYIMYIYIHICFISDMIPWIGMTWVSNKTPTPNSTNPRPGFYPVFFPNFLVVGFNPFETYKSKWESSPNRGEHKNIYLKPPTSFSWCKRRVAFHGKIPLHQGFVKCVFFWVPVHPALFDKKIQEDSNSTPLKIKMEPKKNTQVEKENRLPNLHCWVSCWFSRG